MDNDHEFLAYCDLHSTTQRALFNGAQIARLYRLAGGEFEALAAGHEANLDCWYSADLRDVVKQARQRLVGEMLG